MESNIDTEVVKSPVEFTQAALLELQKLYEQHKHTAESHLRIGVKGGGCSGMTYVLAFDKPEDDDTHFEVTGIPVLLKKSHALYLAGITIDWQNGLNNRGFIFNNPNASSTCGCGTSFSV